MKTSLRVFFVGVSVVFSAIADNTLVIAKAAINTNAFFMFLFLR